MDLYGLPDHLMTTAIAFDAQDSLAHFRQHFVIDDPELIYLDGNSLGRPLYATQALARDLVERQWGQRLIRGWNEGWIDAPARIGAKIARLIGADPDEVLVADATSVNLFKLAVAALRHHPGRRVVLTDDMNFPSDLYILQGAIDLLGQQHRLEIVPSADGIHGPVAALTARLQPDVALLTLSHTLFKSSYTYDVAALTAAAHQAGALVLWDLSHSVGATSVDLHAAGADLAVGCTYKYLNGGPGAPAFLFVRRALQAQLANPISGWMGQHDPFAFGLDYVPADGMRHFLTGTPPVVSLSLIEPGVDLLLEAGMAAVRAKSVQQTGYFIELWESALAPWGFTLKTPRDASRRGSHVTLAHPEGLRIDQALIHDMQVVTDFRAPNNIRFGFAPIYTSFGEIATAVARLQHVMQARLYENYPAQPPPIT